MKSKSKKSETGMEEFFDKLMKCSYPVITPAMFIVFHFFIKRTQIPLQKIQEMHEKSLNYSHIILIQMMIIKRIINRIIKIIKTMIIKKMMIEIMNLMN